MTNTNNRTASPRYVGVQALRALAACLVLLMHTLNYATAGKSDGVLAAIADGVRQFGHAGVDIFFVISGFIIAQQAIKGGNPLGFGVRRALRIYPLYWLTLGTMLLIPAYPGKSDAPVGLEELLLIAPPPHHPAAWTLAYEVQFYVVAGLCLLFGRRAKAALVVWSGLQLLGVIVQWPRTMFVSPLSLEFCIGIAVAFAAQRISLPKPNLVAAAALTAIVGVGLLAGGSAFSVDQWTRLLAWGVPAGLLLWAVVSYEQGGGPTPELFVFAGDASYSLYLWHLPILSAAWMIWREHIGNPFAATAYIVVCIASSALIAGLSWVGFERPIILGAARLTHHVSAGQASPAQAMLHRRNGCLTAADNYAGS